MWRLTFSWLDYPLSGLSRSFRMGFSAGKPRSHGDRLSPVGAWFGPGGDPTMLFRLG
ncbi:hypothetical protein EMIT0P171_50158 [Pseudomonas sp. IT-P171]